MVTDILVAAVAKIQGKHGAKFKREQAAEILRELVGTDQVDHFLKQLVQVPGVVSKGDGRYELPGSPMFCVRHREWRFAVGRVDLAEAFQLLDALEGEHLVFGLATLVKRLKIALDSLE